MRIPISNKNQCFPHLNLVFPSVKEKEIEHVCTRLVSYTLYKTCLILSYEAFKEYLSMLCGSLC